ncbi:transposase [Streptomyces sp. ID03-2B]|uniref:transposase n=1 Tax=Streptomyces sp. ID03-2B TaxID=3028660 RepID=UPI0039F67BB5
MSRYSECRPEGRRAALLELVKDQERAVLAPDELWELFQRVVPEAPSRPQGGGRRRHGDREVPAAIVFVATSGCTRQQLPSASFRPVRGDRPPAVAEWSKAGRWASLHRLVLDELGARGELDWSRCAIDSVNTGSRVLATAGASNGAGTRSDVAHTVRADKRTHPTIRGALPLGQDRGRPRTFPSPRCSPGHSIPKCTRRSIRTSVT